jgi:dTDP-4-amino-4,6-dideoxygalactose transaminase
MIPFIDLTRQHAALRAELLAASARVIDSSQFVLGPEGKALEQELATLCGVPWALGVASGTDALRLTLSALGVGPGHEVITPAFSFVASATTIMMTGATPVFVDIDPATYTLDLAATERAITPRTRAIMPVHLYGQSAPMDRVLELARAIGWPWSRTRLRPSAARGPNSPSGPGAMLRACRSIRPRISGRVATAAWW